MKCPNPACGNTNIEPGEKFCLECGQSLSVSVRSTPEPGAQPSKTPPREDSTQPPPPVKPPEGTIVVVILVVLAIIIIVAGNLSRCHKDSSSKIRAPGQDWKPYDSQPPTPGTGSTGYTDPQNPPRIGPPPVRTD